MKCRIDHDRCESHHRCTNLFPDLFELADSGNARMKGDIELVPDDLEMDAQSAANSCPAGAIQVEY
jgi:ferredoxin